MPPWVMEILIPGGGLLLLAGGAKAWWNELIAARKAKRETEMAEKRVLEERVENLQEKVESLLMDALARERESNTLRAQRLDMDKQLVALATAMAASLDRAHAKDGT
jgi:hypothetical protein